MPRTHDVSMRGRAGFGWLLVMGLSSAVPAAEHREGAEPAAGWTSNAAMVAYFEAVQTLQDRALERHAVPDLVERSLRALLGETDRYARYLSRVEYQRFRAAQESGYAGVGMEIREVQGDGEGPAGPGLLCYPYPESPAERAGIREGDRLLAVDGRTVEADCASEAAARIRGEAGQPVRLSVRRVGEAEPRALEMVREQTESRTVALRRVAGRQVIRVFVFLASTPAELAQAVGLLPVDAAIVIDLRGNQGGGLYEAVDAARMFLPSDRVILTVEKQADRRTWRTDRDGPWVSRTVVLLQDGATASAAEVFAAALTQNGRAEAWGTTSYGKGLTQQVFPLSQGDALILTDGRLLGPGGTSWDETGMLPFRPVATRDIDAALAQMDSAGPRLE